MDKVFNTYTVDQIPQGIFKAIIVPRPIGWISSVNIEGIHNIAPFSYFNIVCDNPPSVMVSLTDQHIEGGEKDTLNNIETTEHFVINLVTKLTFEKMNLSSADVAKHIDEFSFAKIDWLTSNHGQARRVKNSPIQIECKYFKSVELPKGNSQVINRMAIGTIVAIHIDKNILSDGKIDYEIFRPIARLGYNAYLEVNKGSTFQSQRPK